MIKYEYTDTFGGETNYSWVYRGDLCEAKNLRHALRLARKEIGLTGIKGKIQCDTGDFLSWKPRGHNTLLMVFVQY